MSALPGRWALTLRTPIGTIAAEMTFQDHDGALTGTAAGSAETVALHDIRVVPVGDGEQATWTQAITRPMRLNLAFDVVVHGDELHGHARAGRLPRSTVDGRRVLG